MFQAYYGAIGDRIMNPRFAHNVNPFCECFAHFTRGFFELRLHTTADKDSSDALGTSVKDTTRKREKQKEEEKRGEEKRRERRGEAKRREETRQDETRREERRRE
jgi:hypothetical protein